MGVQFRKGANREEVYVLVGAMGAEALMDHAAATGLACFEHSYESKWRRRELLALEQNGTKINLPRESAFSRMDGIKQ